MFRWYIVRTLLYKEILRYRYNWGLLVVVFALLVFSGLVSIGSRYQQLPGQGATEIRQCGFFHRNNKNAEKWRTHLQTHLPSPAPEVFVVIIADDQELRAPPMPSGRIGVELVTPPGDSKEGWAIRYWYGDEAPPGMMNFRDWCARESHAFLGATPRIHEETMKGQAPPGSETLEKMPIIFSALAIFAMYLLSFNLFLSSTGEEREKRVLLGLLLTPASPGEVLMGKILFYTPASLVVALAIVGVYNVKLLLNPLLWLTILSGSIGYIAIGTVVISLVHRQTTINTVSMLYLLVTSAIMLLSPILFPFWVIHFLLMETYLNTQMKFLVAGESKSWMVGNQVAMVALPIIWCIIARSVFTARATSMARAR